MPERPSPTRIANVAFLVFFVLYTAGSIIWLLSGIPPILAGRSLAVHETLHRWGASDRGYVAISSDGNLGQRVTAGSRARVRVGPLRRRARGKCGRHRA